MEKERKGRKSPFPPESIAWVLSAAWWTNFILIGVRGFFVLDEIFGLVARFARSVVFGRRRFWICDGGYPHWGGWRMRLGVGWMRRAAAGFFFFFLFRLVCLACFGLVFVSCELLWE